MILAMKMKTPPFIRFIIGLNIKRKKDPLILTKPAGPQLTQTKQILSIHIFTFF